MAVVNEVSSTLTGGAGLAAAQTIDASAFDCTGTGEASTFYPLSPTASIVGTISTNGDEDYYRVSLVAGQTIRLDIDSTNGLPQDMLLTGFSPSNAQAFIADDNPNGIDPGSNTSFDPFTEFVVSVSGFWTFKVSALNGTFGPYTLHITNLSLPIDAYGSAGADLKVGAATADTIRGFAIGQEAAELGNDTLQGMAGNDTLLGGGGNDRLDGGFDNDSLHGGLSDDTLTGGDGTGSDTLQGGDGNDSLYGAAGADFLQGGIGNDTLIGDPAGNTNGTEADTLQGGDGADSLEGGAGNDSLVGGAGDDTIYGGYVLGGSPPAGQDTITGGDGNDSLIGSDTTGGAGANDTDLILGGAGNDTIIGKSGADRLFGNDGDDSIDGASSVLGDYQSDLIDGGAGNDTLLGGWYDRLRGGDGNDDIRLTLEVGRPQKMPFVDAGAGTDTLTLDIADGNVKSLTFDGRVAGEASITFNSDLSATPIRGVWYGFETYFVEGSDQPDGFNDLLIGGASNDTLYAGGGAGDLLNGGGGNDMLSTRAINGLVVSTDVQMLGGLGNDTLEFVTPIGSATPTSGFGDGGAGNDSLVAGSPILPAVGSIFLDGGAGADTVSVFSGDVVADGGLGIDLLVVTQTTAAALTVVNALGETWAQSATLAIQFSGFERYQLVGNAVADTLAGGAGPDTLDGGGGADSLAGGLGNDLYIVDNAGDVLSDDDGFADSVQASLDWTLADGFEHVALTGTAIAGTGNGVGNKLTGNVLGNLLNGLGGNDTIDGGEGDDTLVGGDGTDTLTGGAGADRFRILSATGGTDRIADFVTGEDQVQFSAAGFAGLTAGMDLLATGHLVFGTAANAAVPQLLLDVAGGRIYWDADGNGATAKVLVVGLTAAPAIAATDLQVVA